MQVARGIQSRLADRFRGTVAMVTCHFLILLTPCQVRTRAGSKQSAPIEPFRDVDWRSIGRRSWRTRTDVFWWVHATWSVPSRCQQLPGTSHQLVDRGIRTHGFEPRSSQTNDIKIDACRFLARCSTLLGYGKDWFAPSQDNVIGLDIRSLCWWLGLPLGQHYNVAMSVHCHKWAPVHLSWYDRRCCQNIKLTQPTPAINMPIWK